MKKLFAVFVLILGTCFFVPFSQAAEDKTQSIADFTDHQRIDALERTLSNIDRRISRLEDRTEKLDRDVSELKRKV